MCSSLDDPTTYDLDDYWPPVETVDPVVVVRRCIHPRRHRKVEDGATICGRCGHTFTQARIRQGRQSRNYGNRAELEAARRYGGQKVGAAGGPVDIRGEQWNTQMKTHRRKPPAEWTKAFSAMAASRERMPRLLVRYVMGPGQPPQDFFVVRGEDWLAWHGKDQ